MGYLKDTKEEIIDVIKFFKERGAIFTSDSDEDLAEKFSNIQSFYFGIDPTGPYLHLGHLSLIISAIHVLAKYFLDLKIVIGGFTSMIGDPSGKKTERRLMSLDEVNSNSKSIFEFLDNKFRNIFIYKNKDEHCSNCNNPNDKKRKYWIMEYGESYTLSKYQSKCIRCGNLQEIIPCSRFPAQGFIQLCNNHDWLSKIGLFEYLFKYGKKIKTNEMINRDSVKNRLDNDSGISYTELSYQVLQAIDFLHLKKKFGVDIQIGGSDQWGNIIAGIDLIKRLGPELYPDMNISNILGITFPLLLNSNGEKFGKTSSGKSIWIHGPDAKPYEIYQYILNCPDSMVDDLINLLTIQEIQKDSENVELRFYQKEVAKQVIQFLFDENTLNKVLEISDLLFGEKRYSLTKEQVLFLPKDLVFKCSLSDVNNITLSDFLISNDLFDSRAEFKRSINDNSLYINDVKQTKENFHTKVTEDLFKSGSMKISIGKKHKYFAILDE